MKDFSRWKSLHDEIENSPSVKIHHDRAKAATVLGKPEEAKKHLEAYAKAWSEHPKAEEYKRLSKQL